MAIALVGILLAVAIRDVPNPDRPQAMEATEALDEAVEAVRSGSVDLTSAPQQVVPGVTGAAVGSERRPLLVSEAAGHCYSLLQTETGDQVGQRFSESWECDPSSAMLLIGPQRGRTQLPPTPSAEPYDWEPLLPDPTRWRPWYLAAVIVLSGVAIGAGARMAITLISGSPPGHEPDLGDPV